MNFLEKKETLLSVDYSHVMFAQQSFHAHKKNACALRRQASIQVETWRRQRNHQRITTGEQSGSLGRAGRPQVPHVVIDAASARKHGPTVTSPVQSQFAPHISE